MGKPESKRPLGRSRRRREDNIKMDLREVGCKPRDWIAEFFLHNTKLGIMKSALAEKIKTIYVLPKREVLNNQLKQYKIGVKI